MNARRRFLSAAAIGGAALAAGPLLAQSPAPGSVLPTRGTVRPGPLPASPSTSTASSPSIPRRSPTPPTPNSASTCRNAPSSIPPA